MNKDQRCVNANSYNAKNHCLGVEFGIPCRLDIVVYKVLVDLRAKGIEEWALTVVKGNSAHATKVRTL